MAHEGYASRSRARGSGARRSRASRHHGPDRFANSGRQEEAVEGVRLPLAASGAQRAKIVGEGCVVCAQTKGITPAHLAGAVRVIQLHWGFNAAGGNGLRHASREDS